MAMGVPTTVPPPAKRAPPGGPDDSEFAVVEPLCAVFRRTLKSEGLKYTPERAQVLDTIIRFDAPFQAEQVLLSVRKAGFRVSKATVYRTIRLLLDAGIVQRLPLGDDDSFYHLVYGRRPCDMIIRTDTREMIAIDVPELEAIREAVCKARGLKVQGHRLYVFATAECEAAPGTAG